MLRTAWVGLQRLPFVVRWPVKWAFVGAVVFLTLYPRPRLFSANVRHLMTLDKLADPDDRALAPWAAEFAALLPPKVTPRQRLDIVDRFVRHKIPYQFDWVTWKVADYLPTIAEIIAAGREDCDGRALIAASLLRRYDPSARVVTDFKHMWVKSDYGECLRPSGRPVLEARREGMRMRWRSLPSIRGPAYGMAVFPIGRELIIAASVGLALADPRLRMRTVLAAAAVLANGLLIVRLAARDPWAPEMWGVWLGWTQMLAALGGLAVAAGRVRRRHRQPAGGGLARSPEWDPLCPERS